MIVVVVVAAADTALDKLLDQEAQPMHLFVMPKLAFLVASQMV